MTFRSAIFALGSSPLTLKVLHLLFPGALHARRAVDCGELEQHRHGSIRALFLVGSFIENFESITVFSHDLLGRLHLFDEFFVVGSDFIAVLLLHQIQ